ncbi:HalOD1 output domain-containing protein [Halorarius litoreus]|uniref:HalOD1 output domain-containing protein n=1 Tax=Halorarius litoreus TaxID=2962676 RepID=UPI0020CD13DE|nr:HalOD1 output domain-containing protein [Halorarius litoreus]
MMETQQVQTAASTDVTIVNSSLDDATITESIVGAVAEREGTDALSLPPLYNAVDIDALEALVAHADASTGLSVTFRYVGWDVTVYADGSVTVE